MSKAHESKLKKERDEVSRLKTELKMVKTRNAELEKKAAEKEKLRVSETQKSKKSLEQIETRAALAECALEELQKRADKWLSELDRINCLMTRKPP